MKYVCLAIAVVTVAACDATPSAPPPPPPKPVTFEGAPLKGGPAEAKAAGFTRCEPDGDAFTCYRANATILGVKADSASLRLDHPTKEDMTKDQTRLAFDGIVFAFPITRGKIGCDYDGERPFACDEGDGRSQRLSVQDRLESPNL